LVLPSPCPPLVIQGGEVHKGEGDGVPASSIVWPANGRIRHVLKPDAVQAILVGLFSAGTCWSCTGDSAS